MENERTGSKLDTDNEVPVDGADVTSERSSMCESESTASVTNYNYSGPTSEEDLRQSKSTIKTRDNVKEVIVIFFDKTYFKSCDGVMRLLQVIFSFASLISLVTCGSDGQDFLQLPLSWHFRVMVFVLVLTLTFSLTIWTFHVTGLVAAMPVNWWSMDMVLYSIFSFLYLVGSSLVASAFDFYQKMDIGIPYSTIQQLILCVILGYICMFLYGLTAFIGYKRWKAQHQLFRRRRLLEEENEEFLNV